MIVIKYKDSQTQGFKDDDFIIGRTYLVIGIKEIKLETIREIIVDGNTVFQSEVA